VKRAAEVTIEARKNFSHYVQIADEEEKDELSEIRKSSQSGAYGDEIFLEALRGELSREKAFKESSFRTESASLQDIIDTVCSAVNLSLGEVQSDKRDKQLVQVLTAMALLTTNLCISSLSALGRKSLLDPTSLAKLAKKAKHDLYIKTLCEEISVQLRK
jgi:hypothetical protein